MRVAVVGAGAVGASIAFHLAREGAKVVLYDREGPGGGASGRSAALVRMHYTFLPDAVLAALSLAEFANWGERVGGTCGFRRTGFLRIVAGSQEGRLRRTVANLREAGVTTWIVRGKEVREIDPRLRLNADEPAAYEPDSGYADPHLTIGAYLNHPAIRTRFAVPVTRVAAQGPRWRLQAPGEPPEEYDAAVLACAFGAAELLAAAGLSPLPLFRQSHIVGFIDNPVNRSRPHVTCIDGPLGIYFRPEGQSLTLCGPNVLPEEQGVLSVPEGARERMLSALSRRMPDAAEGRWHGGYVAQDSHTPDGRAAIGPVAPGLFVAVGFSGTGFKTSPAVGQLLARWITSGLRPPELAPYAPDRFTSGRLLSDEEGYGDE